ncbi:hypothetical protein THMIRHAM_00200 [Thiomicrorhabdus immobilis]|uniref:Outer membrane protein beta-barrel domain-containing protein n=1 Tax=Thiomicrorhabdus immobilis TaxID=2791037 RepID=A0ABN6CTQ8_9GAMM|nr:hypothetical protein [Thiomicrorhabdus immobilis]BCN92235.1 hypothetical protein THMIRHAM_00200 [Thiomicrorhabdus immobilis]
MNHSIFKIILLPVLILLFGMVALNSIAQADENTKLTTGLFYIDGQSDTINSDNVTSVSVPLMLSIKKDELSFGVSMAYLSVKSGSFKESGLGDTSVSIGYDLNDQFTFKLKQKFATGDADKGLSTGKDDSSFQLDYFASLGNQSSIFTTLGYKYVGKVEGWNMQDSIYASVGTGYVYNNKTSIGISLDYRESIFKNLDDQLGFAAFVSKPLNSTYSLTGFAGYDVTSTSSIGVSLTTKF